jgi:hypothetical protein
MYTCCGAGYGTPVGTEYHYVHLWCRLRNTSRYRVALCTFVVVQVTAHQSVQSTITYTYCGVGYGTPVGTE